MYDKHLDAYIKTVECGSFSKAAQELFISPNALIKQVNLLERDTGLKLLERSPEGAVPTKAGTFMYRKALELVAFSQEAIAQARHLEEDRKFIVRLATSQMRPVGKIGALWNAVKDQHPQLVLSIVRVPDDISAWPSFFNNMGRDIDVALAVKPSPAWEWYQKCQVRDVYRSPSFIAIPPGSRFAGRKTLRLEDLEGESLYLVHKGCTPTADALHDAIARDYPGIRVVNGEPYHLSAMNTCAENNIPMLIPEEWTGIHPLFDYARLEGYETILSLIYSAVPSPEVLEFVEAVAQQAKKEYPTGSTS